VVRAISRAGIEVCGGRSLGKSEGRDQHMWAQRWVAAVFLMSLHPPPLGTQGKYLGVSNAIKVCWLHGSFLQGLLDQGKDVCLHP